jgi:hypothetical protein
MSRSRRNRPKIRIIALAAVCCVALLALSASALAMPIRGPINAPNHPKATPYVSTTPGDSKAERYPGATAVQADPVFGPGDSKAERYPGVGPAQTTVTQAPGASVSRVRGVVDNNDHTLVIVLAASALGVALAGAGFALVRSRTPRAAGMH